MDAIRQRKKRFVALALLFVLVALAWMLWPNPHLARARALQKQLTGEQGKNLSPDQRKQLWGQLRAEMEKLPRDRRGELFRKQEQDRMKTYFAMTPKEKVAHLDKQINRMEQFRQQLAKNKQPSQRLPSRSAGSPEEREKRRKERLDRSTTEERVMRSQYFKDLQARRQQRGLVGFGGPRRGG